MPHWLQNGSYLTLALLGACALIAIVVAARFRREVEDDLAPPTKRDLLDPLEKAYYSGLMRREEIERVRESVKKSGTGSAPVEIKARSGPAVPDPKPLLVAGDPTAQPAPHAPDGRPGPAAD